MKLKLAQMWDHNGTNMESIGFMYRGYKVLIALDETDTMSGQNLLPLPHSCTLFYDITLLNMATAGLIRIYHQSAPLIHWSCHVLACQVVGCGQLSTAA